MRCTKSRSSRKPTAAPPWAGSSECWQNEKYDSFPSLCYLPEIFELDYRPGVGTITPATAGTPGICHSQKATHRRKPPPLDIQKRTQSHLLNRINTAFPRLCQVENRVAAPTYLSSSPLFLPVYVHAPA